MIPRTISKKLLYFASKYPVVTLTGPRQSGKSTLLKACFPDYGYISLEDPDELLSIKEDPRLFLRNHPGKTIIDEAQRFTELFSYLQSQIDRENKPGMYILSGSQNFLLMKKVSQSLSGRTALLKLMPFTFQEIKAVGLDEPTPEKMILKGAYPRIYDQQLKQGEFYPFYIQTYLERDIRQLKNVTDLSLFTRFLKMCAARIGQLVNLSNLANQCGISQPTAKAWLSALETSYVVYLLKPHYRNFNKRLVKTPKLYFYDTGLACALLGIKNDEQLEFHYLKGALFENWCIMEYLKQAHHQVVDPEIYFWRDNTGNEIDLLIEEGGQTRAVEIKSGMTRHPDFFEGLTYWQKLTQTPTEQLSIVYAGDKSLNTPHGQLISWRDWGLGVI